MASAIDNLSTKLNFEVFERPEFNKYNTTMIPFAVVECEFVYIEMEVMRNVGYQPSLTRRGEGGMAESAHTIFKDSYLRKEYCYCNEIW